MAGFTLIWRRLTPHAGETENLTPSSSVDVKAAAALYWGFHRTCSQMAFTSSQTRWQSDALARHILEQ